MGGTTFFLFIVETVTGVLLMFYYRPTLEHAYNDILALRDVTTLGILRELHRWGAHAMVIAVWLHMYRVFLTGSYKPPREFNWVVGVLLLVLTLLLSFTGYLLPWDQLAIWAITVGSNMARATPGVGVEGPGASLLKLNGVSLITSGSDAKFALLGGRSVGEMTLEPVLRAALRGDPAGGGAADHDPLLAGPEGRRDQRPDVSRAAATPRTVAASGVVMARDVVLERTDSGSRASSTDRRPLDANPHEDLTSRRDGRARLVLPAGGDDERGRGGVRRLHGDGLGGGARGSGWRPGRGGCPTG